MNELELRKMENARHLLPEPANKVVGKLIREIKHLRARLYGKKSLTISGADLIYDERERQITQEGWTPEHDQQEHPNGELAMMAACYAAPSQIFGLHVTGSGINFIDPWPLINGDGDRRREMATGEKPKAEEWKVKPILFPEHQTIDQRIDLLTKAGALCAAEIDRLEAVKRNQGNPEKTHEGEPWETNKEKP